MPVVGTNRFWTGEEEGRVANCFAWDDPRIRRECQSGTRREWYAYVAAGYITVPHYTPPPTPKEEERPPTAIPDDADIYSKEMSCHDVAIILSAKHCLPVALLRGRGRNKTLVAARKEFCCVCVNVLKKSHSVVARYLNRDRTTISHYL